MSAALPTLLPGPTGDLEVLTVGHGDPRTVFAHGLAGSIPTTRPYAVRVRGQRTFLHFRGHGRSSAPQGDWTYRALAEELWAVADRAGAARALGVSMGAGAVCAGLAADPDRFERLVLVLPAVIDRPREDAAMRRFGRLADLVDADDVDGAARHLLAEQPEQVRDDPGVRQWCREHAERLVPTAVASALRTLPHQRPVDDRSALGAVRAPVLLLAQEDDDAHPVAVARELAQVFPRARLEVLPPGGIMWGHRARVRDLVGSFLSTDAGEPTP